MKVPKEFYVIVCFASAPHRLLVDQCGLLHATEAGAAEIEAGKYREKLNNGKGLEELNGQFKVVYVPDSGYVEGHRALFDAIKTQRVT